MTSFSGFFEIGEGGEDVTEGLERGASSGGSSMPYSWASLWRRHLRSSRLMGESGMAIGRFVVILREKRKVRPQRPEATSTQHRKVRPEQ